MDLRCNFTPIWSIYFFFFVEEEEEEEEEGVSNWSGLQFNPAS